MTHEFSPVPRADHSDPILQQGQNGAYEKMNAGSASSPTLIMWQLPALCPYLLQCSFQQRQYVSWPTLLTSHLVQVVVKVGIPSTEISSQQSGVCSEDRCHGNLAGARENNPWTRLPLVEMTDDIELVSQLVCQLENKRCI